MWQAEGALVRVGSGASVWACKGKNGAPAAEAMLLPWRGRRHASAAMLFHGSGGGGGWGRSQRAIC